MYQSLTTKYETDIPEINKQIPLQKINSFESKSNNNNFDPNKSSPPNDFMIKLYNRIRQFDNKLEIPSEK